MKLIVCLSSFLWLISSVCSKVSISINPGCTLPDCHGAQPKVKIIYTRYQRDVDSLHYLWSFTESSYPTLLIIKSDSNVSTVRILWDRFINGNRSSMQGSVQLKCAKLSCHNSSHFSSVYLLQSVIQYNDTKNNADITDKGNFNISTYDLSRLRWKYNISDTDNSILVQGSSIETTQSFSNVSLITIKFMTKNKTGRGLLFPHLPFNDQSSMLEVVLNNLSAAHAGSRFALKVVVTNPGNASNSGGKINGDVTKIMKWSIDDEYSPSVFTTQQILWQKKPKHHTSFWIWRTVCYTKPKPTRTFSSDVQTTSLILADNSTLKEFRNNSVLFAYFGQKNINKLPIKTSIVSFGKPDDGFYAVTKYVSWTSLVGAGEPPSDSLSLLVVCIIFAGVGCPVLVILFGSAYLAFRKCRKHKNSHLKVSSNYEPIG